MTKLRKARTTRTPMERAQQTVDALDRRLTKVLAAKTRLIEELKTTQTEYELLQKRLAHAQANPDLYDQAALDKVIS